jgi:hypothetical protein
MGRICVELPDELEKKLRFKTIERFGGKKGDLSKAVEESIRTWLTADKYTNEQITHTNAPPQKIR